MRRQKWTEDRERVRAVVREALTEAVYLQHRQIFFASQDSLDAIAARAADRLAVAAVKLSAEDVETLRHMLSQLRSFERRRVDVVNRSDDDRTPQYIALLDRLIARGPR